MFGFSVLAENVCRALQKLLLPLCNLVTDAALRWDNSTIV
jgi:hypothetical protein